MADDNNFASDSVPYDDSAQIDSMQLNIGGVLPDKTNDDVNKSEFVVLQPGEYCLRVVDFELMKDDNGNELHQQTVIYNGESVEYWTKRLRVNFALHPDHNAEEVRVSDFFTLPPADEAGLFYYNNAGSQDKKSSRGFHGKKLRQFLSHLGLSDPTGQKLLPEADIPGNWRYWSDGKTPRWVTATIENNTVKNQKTGADMTFNQIKMMSYQDSILNVPPLRPQNSPPRPLPPGPPSPGPQPVQSRPAQQPPPAARPPQPGPVRPPTNGAQAPTRPAPTQPTEMYDV